MSRSHPSSQLRVLRLPRLELIGLAMLVLFFGHVAVGCGPTSTASRARPKAAQADAADVAARKSSAHVYADDPAVDEAGRRYLDLVVETSPETATELGLHARDGELDDRTLAGNVHVIERKEAFLRSLRERFRHARLSPAAQTDLALLTGALEVDIEKKRVERPLHRKPTEYAGPLNAIFLMTARAYAPAPERARNVVLRLEKIPKMLETAKTNLQNPPRVWTQVGIDRAASAHGFLEAQRPFLVAALPAETARIDAALKGAEKAYEDYKSFLKREVLARSDGRFAAGREHFEFLLKHDYFLDEGADELLAMGKRVFAETAAQMNEVARRIDPKAKGWPEVVNRLKSNHPTAAGLLDAYRHEVSRARAFLVEKDVVDFPPGDDLQVIDTPPFLRSTLTAAYDQPPPFDTATTRGFFFVTPVDQSLPRSKQEEMLRENDHGDLVDTAVHEAYPGHHLQLSFARLHPSLVRKALDSAIFSEGWALYSEELMSELGYYTDEERLLQLEWTLVRAARVVIDVGLHVSDMAFEEAVKMLTDEVHLERQLALSEVKRYTLRPTQPLAYLVGRQMILRLREDTKTREGGAFSLKKFHTDILTRGTVPPSLLAREILAGQRDAAHRLQAR